MNEDKILFSIVIPAYNEEKMLPACLSALKKIRPVILIMK